MRNHWRWARKIVSRRSTSVARRCSLGRNRLISIATALTVVGLGLVVTSSGAEARAGRPVISGLAASPAPVPWQGGAVTLSASVNGASQCTFSSPSPSIAGLPNTVACDSGTVSLIVTVAANTSSTGKSLPVALVAVGTPGNAIARTRIELAAAPARPVISGFVANPAPVPWQGGPVTLSASVADATLCTLSTSSAAITGLPTTVGCDSGSASVLVAVTGNATTVAKRYPVILTATGPQKSSSTSTSIVLAPGPSPIISTFGSTPTPVSWTGGQAMLSATVANATSCTFSAEGRAKAGLSDLPATVPCGSGTASVNVVVATNHRRKSESYTVKLTATGSGATVVSTTTVTISPITAVPVISGFGASPSPVVVTGGMVSLSATVADAVTCTFTAKGRKARAAVVGVPVSEPCSNGTVTVPVTVPANSHGRPQSFPVELTVRGYNRKVIATTFIIVG